MGDRSDDVDDKLVDLTDETQFNDLVERYTTALFRYARSWVHDPDVAEEVVQDALTNVWAGVREGRLEIAEPGKTYKDVRKYLLKVVRNAAISYYRRLKQRQEVPLEGGNNREESKAITQDTPETEVAEKEVLALIKDKNSILYEGISARDRHILDLLDREGLPYKELAERFEITVSNVGRAISRARNKFWANMVKHGILQA